MLLIGKNEKEIVQIYGKCCQKARTTDKAIKNKIYDSGKEKTL
jgi:hypothetical protein